MRKPSSVPCLLLALLLTLACVPKIALSEEREPVKIKVLKNDIDTARSSLEDEVGREIYEKFKTEIEFVPYTESHFEKALMMLAAQDWGDLDIVNTALDDVTKKYIDAGALVRLDDYRDQLTDFFAYEKDLIPLWRNLDQQNGDLYVWQAGPDQIQMTNPPYDIVVRVDALEACGWPELETTDDYVAFLKEALQKIPESNGQSTIGMNFFYGDPIGPLLSTYLPRHSGMQHFYKATGLVDVESGKIVPLVTHPYAKETARFYNTLWREGIMDREAWTDGFQECEEKMKAGVSLSTNFMVWGAAAANQKAIERGTPEMQYIVMPIRLQIAKDEGVNVRYELYTSVRPDETQGILKTSKNVDRIIELVNYFSSEEMTKRIGWGVEGRDYTVNEEGKLVCTAEFIAGMNGPDAKEIRQSKIVNGEIYGSLFPTRMMGLLSNGQPGRFSTDPDYNMASATDVQLKAYEAYGWNNLMSPWTEDPNIEFVPFDITNYQVATNLDPATDIAKTEEKIIAYMNQQLPIVITSETEADFERNYEEMVKRALDYGVEDVVAKYNEQLASIDDRIEELSKR